MKRIAILNILIFAALGVSACSRTLTENEEEEDVLDLVSVDWELFRFRQTNGVTTRPGSEGMHIRFFDNGQLEGRGYPIDNPEDEGYDYSSTYEVGTDGALSIEPPEAARNQVLIPRGSRWFEYLDALAHATSYIIEEEELVIFYRDNRALIYRPIAQTNPD
jgi:hypothetical protein